MRDLAAMTSAELVEAAKSQFALAINAALTGRGNVEINPFSILDEIDGRLDAEPQCQTDTKTKETP